MLDFDPAALDRHICEGPSGTCTVDVNCLACGEEFEALASGDMGTVDLEPSCCPGCGRDDSLAVVS